MVVGKPPCKLNSFCASATAESRARFLLQWNAFGTPCGLGCCPFLGGGSAFFHLLFNVFRIVGGGSVFVFVLLCITLSPFYPAGTQP